MNEQTIELRTERVRLNSLSRKVQKRIDQDLISVMLGDDMSRSRGRGAKPKARQQAQRGPEPFMMFQIYDRLPWMEVKWVDGLAPKGLNADSMVRELVEVIRKHMAEAEIEASRQVRVSGVPYAVDVGKVNGTDVIAHAEPEPEPEQPAYPY